MDGQRSRRYRHAHLAGGAGDVQGHTDHAIHQVNGQTQILCTPLVYRGHVYIIRYNGVLVVFDAKTGDKKYEQQLAGATNAFTASPVANNGKVYAASEDGQVFVLKAGPTYEVLAMNEMSTPVLATPAISGPAPAPDAGSDDGDR